MILALFQLLHAAVEVVNSVGQFVNPSLQARVGASCANRDDGKHDDSKQEYGGRAELQEAGSHTRRSRLLVLGWRPRFPTTLAADAQDHNRDASQRHEHNPEHGCSHAPTVTHPGHAVDARESAVA